MDQEFSKAEGHQALETDIERLQAEVSQIRGQAEARDLSDKEVLRAAIDRLVPREEHHPGTTPALPQNKSEFLPEYTAEAPLDVKLEIEGLLDEAFHEGISKAISRARKANPYVLDAFHDVLTGKLYEEFKNRGFLK